MWLSTLIVYFSIIFQVKTAKLNRNERFDGLCRGSNDTFIELGDYSSNSAKMNMTITIKQDIDPEIPLKLNVKITRCRSPENLDSCETFKSFTTKQYCKFLEMRSRMWGNFFGSFHPQFQCPIKKGVYKLINGEVNLAGFSNEKFYWKISSEAFYGQPGRKVMCLYNELNLL